MLLFGSMNERIFEETGSASTYKEIRRRDPSFSLPDFVSEIQEAIRPVLNAYSKGDAKTLKKYCSKELIERCTAEHRAFTSQGYFFDHKVKSLLLVHPRDPGSYEIM
jgi:import inner membrane translocase subunit TIM44